MLGSKANKYVETEEPWNAEIQVSYAQLEGARYDPSVLLLKVGSLTVMEWSHSGRRAESAVNKLAPKLYQERYRRQSLISDCDDRVTHDHRGNWQTKLHRIIRDKGGVRKRI